MTRPAAADLRLLPATAAAWLGAGIAIGVPTSPWVLVAAIVLWVAAAVLAVVRVPGAARGLAVLALAGGAMTLTSAAGQLPAHSPPLLTEAAHAGRSVQLVVAVTGRATDGRIPGTAQSARIAGVTTVLSVPVLLFGEPGDAAIRSARIGQTLRVTGSVEVADPGEDVAFLVFLRGSAVAGADPPGLLAAADAVRQSFRHAASALPGDGGDLLPGLAIGDTSSVSPALDGAMKTSSQSHSLLH